MPINALTHGDAPHDAREEARYDDFRVDLWPVPHQETVDNKVERAGQQYATIVTKQVVDICMPFERTEKEIVAVISCMFSNLQIMISCMVKLASPVSPSLVQTIEHVCV